MTEANKSFVDLVLERMDTNPEEFIEGSSKSRWDTLMQGLRQIGVGPQNLSISSYNNHPLWALTEDEIKALSEQYKKVYREFLRREFLKNIMGEHSFLNTRSGILSSGTRIERVENASLKNSLLTTGIQQPSTVLPMVSNGGTV